MKIFWTIVGVIIFVIGVAFSLLNMEQVSVDFYLGGLALPLAAVIIGSFVVGGIFGLLVGYLHGRWKR